MESHQRIKFLIDKFYNGNQAAFANAIGIKPQTISNLINRGSNPGFKIINGILAAIPEVNAHWLITGEGSPVQVSLSQNDVRKSEKNIKKGIYSDKKSTIETLVEKDASFLVEKIYALEREIELLKDNLAAQKEVIDAKNLLINHLQKIST